jgi:hypothetical protein
MEEEIRQLKQQVASLLTQLSLHNAAPEVVPPATRPVVNSLHYFFDYPNTAGRSRIERHLQSEDTFCRRVCLFL